MAQQTQRLRSIDFPSMLYECLRAYYSVNAKGQVNSLYKLEAACVQPLQAPWNAYDKQRRYIGLIAGTKFQIGNAAAVLNYLYDNVENRIFITQGFYDQTVAREFSEPAIAFGSEFGETAIIFAREFGDAVKFVDAVIHVPSSVNLSQLTATVAQLALEGTNYIIVTF